MSKVALLKVVGLTLVRMSVKKEPNKVRKNNDSPIIEDWVSDDEEQDESTTKPVKKTVIPTAAKIEKLVKKSVRPRVVNTARSNRTSVNAARANRFNAVKRPLIVWGKPQHDDKGLILLANVNAIKMTWAPKLQLFSNSYHLRHCLRGGSLFLQPHAWMKGCVISVVCSKGIKTHLGISQEVGTPRYLSLLVPLTKVYDEAVHKELGDIMERAATTASRGVVPVVQIPLIEGDVNAQTRKNEVLFSEEVDVHKREVGIKQYEINMLKTEFEKVKQEKDGIEFKIEKFDKLDLSYSGLDEFQQPEFEGYGLRANKISDNEDEVESPVVVKKKTVFPTAAKIEFVRPKQHEKPVRKPVKYTEMYMSQRPRENQRNWNNQKSQQLGSDFVMNNKACFITVAGDDSVVPTTNEEITLAQTLIQIKAAKPKVVTTTATTATTTRPKDRGVVVQEPSEFRVPQEIKPSSSKDKGKDAQAKEIVALKKRIQRLERRKISRPIGLKRLRKVGMSQRVESSEDQESLGVLEDASKQGRSIADIDADVEMPVEAKVDGKDEQSTKTDEQSTKTNDNTDDSLAERLQSESFKLLFV
ncbi:hypothetical protein Tco_0727052 [Tanacetum coccineum]|uniref:Uncharacterized protein n=1 Tax=Tanacetum coccineum TaxID=301880 RepID=A0ABQ4YID9_9ASTR